VAEPLPEIKRDSAATDTGGPSVVVPIPRTDGQAGASENQSAPVATPSAPVTTLPPFSISCLRVGAPDGRNEPIEYIFFKRTNYAIYRARGLVIVCYSDDQAEATKQIIAVAPLIPMRDTLQNLAASLPDGQRYSAQIAEALRMGLENQIEAAKNILQIAINDATETRVRIGRLVYLKYAATIALAAAAFLVLVGNYLGIRNVSGLLLLATGAGAIGALHSIAIAIRARSVSADGDRATNAMDGTLRVFIGIISASVLFLLLSSGVLANLEAGGVTITGENINWQMALLVGFPAGFLERLVPDLLEKKK
jgi:hypothetical protein